MVALTEAIDAFEQTFVKPVQNWSAMVGEEDLDALIESLEKMDAVSSEISQLFAADDRALFESRWLPLLDSIRCQLPAIQAHVERLRAEARANLGQVQQVHKGFKGYRKTLPSQSTSFESEG